MHSKPLVISIILLARRVCGRYIYIIFFLCALYMSNHAIRIKQDETTLYICTEVTQIIITTSFISTLLFNLIG